MPEAQPTPAVRPKKKRLSFSAINLFLQCARKYYYSYILNIWGPMSGAMVQSRAWHQVIEFNLRQKIKSEKDLAQSVLTDLFIERFDEQFRIESVKLNDDEDRGDLGVQGVELTKLWLAEIAPPIFPLFVEKRFLVPLGDDLPFDLAGVWDIITKDQWIRDSKAYSPKKPLEQKDIDRDLQFSIYSLAYRSVFGEVEKGLQMDGIIKNNNLAVLQLQTQRSEKQTNWTLGLIEQVAIAIERGAFPPNPTSWSCTPKFCGHWDRCSDDFPKGGEQDGTASSTAESS